MLLDEASHQRENIVWRRLREILGPSISDLADALRVVEASCRDRKIEVVGDTIDDLLAGMCCESHPHLVPALTKLPRSCAEGVA